MHGPFRAPANPNHSQTFPMVGEDSRALSISQNFQIKNFGGPRAEGDLNFRGKFLGLSRGGGGGGGGV